MIGHDEYLEAQVMTAAPYRLHLMVLDAALRHAKRADEAFARRDHEACHFALCRSRDCVGELLSGLDSEETPDVVDTLKSLFAFVYRSLAHADLYHDAQRLRDAVRILEMHRETWLELGRKLQAEESFAGGVETGTHDWTT